MPHGHYNLFFQYNLIITLFLVFIIPGLSQAAPHDLIPAAPAVKARAYVLMDANSGRVLVEKKSQDRIEPASMTKIMTTYVVFDELRRGSIKLEDQVKVSEKAWRKGGSKMFIEVNSYVTVKELLMGVIVQSGNDASIALAEHVAGSEEAFVNLMNKHAEVLGMTQTNFMNSTGWPDKKHYTSAHDLALLSRALIKNFPEQYKLFSVKHYKYNNIKQPNRNRLLWVDERVDGVKTGHTESAGYCLVASGQSKNMRLISVVAGTNSEKARETSSRKLLGYGFRFYETFLLHEAIKPMTTMRIYKGSDKQLKLGVLKDLYITAPRGARKNIKANIQVENLIYAPAKKGQAFGKVNVTLGEQTLANHDLVALEDVAEGGLWRKLVDNVILMFE